MKIRGGHDFRIYGTLNEKALLLFEQALEQERGVRARLG